jgi:hypothetical protein
MSWISERIVELQNTFATFLAANQPETVETVEVQVDFNDFKVVELRTIAKERGFKGYTTLRKAQLVELLEQN